MAPVVAEDELRAAPAHIKNQQLMPVQIGVGRYSSENPFRLLLAGNNLDPQPGGIYRVEMGDRIVARGEYVELDRPSRVVFTWGWEGQESSGPNGVPPGSSRVEVTLEPDGEGTLVRLRHLDLPEETRQIHGEGWDLYLGRLAVVAAGGDPGADPAGAQQAEKEE